MSNTKTVFDHDHISKQREENTTCGGVSLTTLEAFGTVVKHGLSGNSISMEKMEKS